MAKTMLRNKGKIFCFKTLQNLHIKLNQVETHDLRNQIKFMNTRKKGLRIEHMQSYIGQNLKI